MFFYNQQLNHPWSTFRDLERWMNDIPNSFLNARSHELRNTQTLPLNIWANEQGAIVTAELPGVEAKNVQISVFGDTLTLSVALSPSPSTSEIIQESAFKRSVQLPHKIDPEGTKAQFKDGILRIELTRSPQDQPRKVAIQTA